VPSQPRVNIEID